MPDPTLNTVALQACLDRWRAGEKQGADDLLRMALARLEKLARRMTRAFPNVRGVADTDQWVRFHEAVDQLPIEEREVVGLVFYHGWTQEKIAELFHVDERTIRRRWSSACQHLREAVGGEMPGD